MGYTEPLEDALMKSWLAVFAMTATLTASATATGQQQQLSSLQGTWMMESAYEIKADGTRTTTYGEHPKGLLIIDTAGRYNLQIFRVGRPSFASGDKARGTTEEYREAVLGSSTHFGTVTIDPAKHQLIFKIEAASFPNWEGQTQLRDYAYQDGLLTYAVPASASGSGTVAYSVWRRSPK
jgi:Lipocalin-like domain